MRRAAAAAAAPPLPLLREGGELAAAGGRLEAGSEACRTKAEEEAARERPATEGLAAVVAIVVAAALGGAGDSKEVARWGGGDRASVVLAPLVSEVEASFFFCSCSSTDFSLELTFMIGAGGRGGLGGLGGLFIFPSTTAGAAWFAVGAAEAGSTILDGDGGVGPWAASASRLNVFPSASSYARSAPYARSFPPFSSPPTSFCSLPLNASLVYAMYARGILPLSLHLPPIAYSFPSSLRALNARAQYFLVCCVLFCVKRSLFPAFPIQISDVQKTQEHALYT